MNVILAEMFTDNRDHINRILNDLIWDSDVSRPYQDINLEVVEGIARKLKNPKRLFDELMKSDSKSDRKRGLYNLGFREYVE